MLFHLLAIRRETIFVPINGVEFFQINTVDWTEDEDEPAYDVNVVVNGRPVSGGAGVFSTRDDDERAARRKAQQFADMLVGAIVKASGGRL